MKTNTERTVCVICANPIPAKGGVITNEGPMHLICRARRTAAVTSYRHPDGDTIIENTDGRCEDAPACGCCGRIPAIPEAEYVAVLMLMSTELPTVPTDGRELQVSEFRHGLEVKIPDGIDASPDRRLDEIEIEAEEILKIEERTDGQWSLAGHKERDGIHLVLWKN